MTRDSKLDTLKKRKKKEKTPIYTFSFHVINPFPFHVINPFHTLLSTLLFYIIFNNIQFLKAIATLLMQWSFPSFCTHTYQVSFQSSVLLPFQKIIMASLVLSSPLGQFSKLENRPVANYHPTIWGDQFISYTPEDEVIELKYVLNLIWLINAYIFESCFS